MLHTILYSVDGHGQWKCHMDSAIELELFLFWSTIYYYMTNSLFMVAWSIRINKNHVILPFVSIPLIAIGKFNFALILNIAYWKHVFFTNDCVAFIQYPIVERPSRENDVESAYIKNVLLRPSSILFVTSIYCHGCSWSGKWHVVKYYDFFSWIDQDTLFFRAFFFAVSCYCIIHRKPQFHLLRLPQCK